MGGGPQASKQFYQGSEPYMQNLNSAVSGLQQQTGAVSNLANQAANKINTNYSQYKSGSYAPDAAGLNPFYKNIVAQGTQDANSRLASTNAQIGRQFAGNPAAQAALRAQASVNTAGNTNPLLFQAGVQQNAEGANAFQLNNAARQQNANLQNLGNQTVGQQFQLQSLPLQLQQSLASTLAGLSQIYGQSFATPLNQQDKVNAGLAPAPTGNKMFDNFTGRNIQSNGYGG